MFWNPEDEQIPRLSLGHKFDQDLRQQTGKQGVHFLMTSTVLYEKLQKSISIRSFNLPGNMCATVG